MRFNYVKSIDSSPRVLHQRLLQRQPEATCQRWPTVGPREVAAAAVTEFVINATARLFQQVTEVLGESQPAAAPASALLTVEIETPNWAAMDAGFSP
ncbi:hypothetical protein MycrhDRAFT_6257 [Mycolicibacterium rhodesiae JS60]|nr:hypothetical protein MycrhDRAFT_6257 [Mycolicibacterium rhodesiae JS60]